MWLPIHAGIELIYISKRNSRVTQCGLVTDRPIVSKHITVQQIPKSSSVRTIYGVCSKSTPSDHKTRVTSQSAPWRLKSPASGLFTQTVVLAHQGKHESSASLVFVRVVHRWRGDSPHKGAVTRKCLHLKASSCYKKSRLSSEYGSTKCQNGPFESKN